MSFHEIRIQVKAVLDKYGVKTNPLPSEQPRLLLSETGWNLLEVIDVEGPDVLIINNWDDCNTYQEEGYYIEELSKIDKQSKNNISINNISEQWDDKGNVHLTFTANEDNTALDFNHLEERDNVPLKFVEYINKLLLNYEGESRFVLFEDEGFDYYCLLPRTAINDLQFVKGVDLKKLGYTNNITSEVKPKDDHPIQEGLSVKHATYGEGVVLKKEGQGVGLRVQVDFKDVGSKWLVLQYAKLELV